MPNYTSNITEIQNLFPTLTTVISTFKLLAMLLGIILQVFIIAFERFGRDPAKRSLVNRLIGSIMEWLLFLTCNGLITDGIYASLDQVNFKVGLYLGFPRRLCVIGGLLTINEALLIRYIINVCLKRIPVINDDLLAMCLKYLNGVLSLLFTVIQAHLTPYQLHPFRLWAAKQFKEQAVIFPIGFILVATNVLLTFIIGLHLFIRKMLKKSSTPVIQINLIHPTQSSHPIVLNNQAYNKDIFDFTAYFIFVLAYVTLSMPFPIVIIQSVSSMLALYFGMAEDVVINCILYIREFAQTVLICFLFPAILITCSSELRNHLLIVAKRFRLKH